MGRRRFLGASLAAAGAALIPSTGVAAVRPSAARGPSTSLPPAPGASGPIPQLPVRDLFPNVPALPVDLAGTLDTLERLEVRSQQVLQAKQGLTQRVTIDGITRRAYAFLFSGGREAANRGERLALAEALRNSSDGAPAELRRRLDTPTSGLVAETGVLSLTDPEQFSVSWTSFNGVYRTGQRRLEQWSKSLTDPNQATKQFWPMISEHGLGYNLILPERIKGARARELRRAFGRAWTRQVREALDAGELYAIDMTRFESLQPQTVNGSPRFTPATLTLLIRNPRTRDLRPVAVAVSGFQGAGRQVYSRQSASSGAWLYALQAAKASVTLYGVWLGHVYHWHLVTAAMQMTMFNTLPASHPVRQLLAPQSNFAIPFDDALLGLWSQIAPPTSIASASQFLGLINDFAAGREYFDDDPLTTLDQLGLRERDFSAEEPWDRYPVVARLLSIWGLVSDYVETFVRVTYPTDAAVAADAALSDWIATSASADASVGGNIRGLPAMASREALERVLKSLLYRITVHGISRLNSSSNPSLTYVPNFPHCLQRTDIPRPGARIGTRRLLSYLPNTDSIAQAVTFYFTFAFSTPYVPFIPLSGVGENLFFEGGKGDPRNRALVRLRKGLGRFIDDYQPAMPQRFQWPLDIET